MSDPRVATWIFIGAAAIVGWFAISTIPSCGPEEVYARGAWTLVCVKGHR